MKILMTTMKMDIGGAETHVLEVARELARRGLDITVASAGGVFVTELERAGVRHIYVPLSTRNVFDMLKSYRILSKLMRNEQFDLIHAHARIPAYLSRFLSKRFHVHMVTTAHGTFKVNALLRHVTCWGEKSLAVSEDIKQYLIDAYGVFSGNIGVTINGINMETFSESISAEPIVHEFSLRENMRRIVHVSRLNEDCSATADALIALVVPLAHLYADLEILIVGDGSELKRLQRQAEEANRAAGRRVVILTGARTDINRLIAAGDIFVGVSRAALEAMAMAKPTILSGNEGYLGIYSMQKFQDAFSTNFCCRGFPLLNRDFLYRDLCQLLDASPEQLSDLAQQGKATVRTHYSVAAMADDYERMYRLMKPYAYYRHGDILVIGYYGFRNTGDDSLLRLIVRALRGEDENLRISALAHRPHAAALSYGIPCIDRKNPFAVWNAMRHAKMLIAGGGNLLQDKTSRRSLVYYTSVLRLAKKLGLKVMVWANGLGPLLYESSVQRVKRCLGEADLITLREPESDRTAKKLGIDPARIRLTSDPSFLAPLPEAGWILHLRKYYRLEAGKRYYAVSLRNWQEEARANIEAFASVCDRIAEKYGMTAVFIPMQEGHDYAVTQRVRGMMRTQSLLLLGASGEELQGLLRDMSFAISMRLHTLIYGASAGIPVIGISYDKKLDAFLSYIGMSPALPEMVAGSEELYFSAATRAVMCADELRQTIANSRAMLADLAAEDAKSAMELYRGN